MLGAAALKVDHALKVDNVLKVDPALKVDNVLRVGHALTESKGLDILDPNDNDLRRPGVSVKVHCRPACVPKAGAIVSLIRGVWKGSWA